MNSKPNHPWFPPNDNYPPIFPTFPVSQRLDYTTIPRYQEPVNVVMRHRSYCANPMARIDRNVRPVVGGGVPTTGTYPRDIPTMPVAALKHTMSFSHPGLKGRAEGYNH